MHQSRGDDPPLRERHHTPWASNSLSAQALLSMAKWPELRDQIEGMLPRVSKSWLWFKWLGGSLCNLVYYRLSSLWLALDCMTKYYVRNVGWSFTLFYAFWSSGYIYVAGVRRVIIFFYSIKGRNRIRGKSVLRNKGPWTHAESEGQVCFDFLRGESNLVLMMVICKGHRLYKLEFIYKRNALKLT